MEPLMSTERDDDDLPGDEAPAPAKKPEAKAQPAPVEKPAPPTKQVHTKRLTELALSMGFTHDDLDDHPSSVIWEEIDRINAMSKREAAPDKPAPKEPVVEPEFNLDNPELDPAFAKYLKAQRDELAALKTKAERVDKLEEAEKTRQTRSANESVDTAFAALGKSYEALVGTDAMTELTDPGQKGWRVAIFQKAKVNFQTDSQRTINRKIAEAAIELAKGKVKDETEPEADAYAKPKKAPAKDPETGRFTKEDFERGQVARPSARKPSAVEVNGVDALHRHLKETGDPRGDRPAYDDDDSDLPG